MFLENDILMMTALQEIKLTQWHQDDDGAVGDQANSVAPR